MSNLKINLNEEVVAKQLRLMINCAQREFNDAATDGNGNLTKLAGQGLDTALRAASTYASCVVAINSFNASLKAGVK